MSLPGLKHPGRWLWLLLLAPILIGFVRLRLDFDVLNLLPQDNPSVRGLKIYQEHFTSARELVLAFRSEDPEALAKRIAFLLDDREAARRMGENARRRVEDRFGIGNNMKKMEKLSEKFI